MRRLAFLPLALVILLAGCAGYDGHSLVPGQATGEEVEKVMGPSKDKRAGPNGGTVLWFPRLPAGRVSYAALIGKDDRLIVIEQRLTRQYLDQLKPGVSRENDVLDVLGPPYRMDPYPRMQRDAWTYQAQGIQPQIIVVQFSKDSILREAYMIDDPDYISQQSSD